ncbi:alkaline phosphatase PhoX [Streptomyces puniciscabiei]
MSLTRRDFAGKSAITGAGVALTGSVGALATAPNALAATDIDSSEAESAHAGDHGVGYGPLVPDPNGILALPVGFSYRIVTHSGRTRLESGEFTPSHHDGTAAFEGPRGTTLLVNNHELKGSRAHWPYPVPLTEGLVYDPAASGGCTVVNELALTSAATAAGGAEAKPEYSEFTGVTFSPDGRTLFANIQEPGVMLAITGPWKRQRR